MPGKTSAPRPTATPAWAGPLYQEPQFSFSYTECHQTSDGGYATSYRWTLKGVFYEVGWELLDSNGNAFEGQTTGRPIGYRGASSTTIQGEYEVGLPNGPQSFRLTLRSTWRDPTSGEVHTKDDSRGYNTFCE